MAGEVFSLAGKRVWVAGHGGMVGSAIVRRLETEDCEILTVPRSGADLRRQEEVVRWMDRERPQVVFLAAARVGGILANSRFPAEFLYDNLALEANVIHAAYRTGVEKLVLLGSTCIYPKMAPQPIPEAALLTGPLEPTNEWYAIAKIAGVKLCQAYRRQYGCDFFAAQPTNLYGPGDNYDLEASHVLPALLRKAHEARLANARFMTVWGSGRPMREFMHVDDLADAVVFLAKHYSDEQHINVGSGDEISIRDLAKMVCEVAAFEGRLVFDTSKPDGAPRKLADANRLKALGWRRKIELRAGIRSVYDGWKLDLEGRLASAG